MGESDSFAGPVSRKGRGKRLLLGIALMLLLLATLSVGWWCYLWTQAANKLASAIAKLDQEDPGWRWDELQAKRVIIPDGENAAVQLEAAFRLLPGGWPANPAPRDDKAENRFLVEQILDLEPVAQLNDVQTKELRVELEKVKPALVEARKLTHFAKGRYPAVAPEKVLSGPGAYEHARPVANLLLADAALLTHVQKMDAALDSCRAILNAARALGDEPTLVAPFTRIACGHLAVVSTERILAQGQPSDDAMRACQELFEDEAQQPLLLYAVRGQRAFQHEHMGWMEAGDLKRLSGGTVTSNPWWAPLEMSLFAGWMKETHVQLLEVLTEAVEITRLPLDEQAEKLHDLEMRVKTKANAAQSPGQFFIGTALPSVIKVADACARSRAQLRCAIAALALERYRLVHHRWPASLDNLVPEFLNQVPLDPYDRKPLRYQRLEDGVAIYSVGPDGIDNGGKLDRKNYVAPGNDMVFRLWDVSLRGKPSSKGRLDLDVTRP